MKEILTTLADELRQQCHDQDVTDRARIDPDDVRKYIANAEAALEAEKAAHEEDVRKLRWFTERLDAVTKERDEAYVGEAAHASALIEAQERVATLTAQVEALMALLPTLRSIAFGMQPPEVDRLAAFDAALSSVEKGGDRG
jgi:hypothetical protein